MGLLRDESGYVLVLGRPRLMVVGGTAAAKEETKKPVEIAAKPALVAACSVPHYCFYCSWCGEQVLLPTDRIGSHSATRMRGRSRRSRLPRSA